MWWQFGRLIQIGLEDHVTDAIANSQQKLDQVLGERYRVEGEGPHLGDVRA